MDLDIPSVYTIMQQELNSKDEKYFVHKLTYIIEFSNRKGTLESVMHEFQSIIRSQKNFNTEELISGVLILKLDYGVHILEGSDCAVVKHLKKLTKLAHEKATNLMFKIKIFNLETHIEKRVNHKWKCIDLSPKTGGKENPVACSNSKQLLVINSSPSKVEDESEESLFYKTYENTFKSLQQIQSVLVEKASTLIKLRQHLPICTSPDHIIPVICKMLELYSKINCANDLFDSEQYDDVAAILKSISEIFPDISSLNYLINSDHLEELEKFSQKLLKAPAAELFHENIWPVPSTFIPLYFDVSEFELMRD